MIIVCSNDVVVEIHDDDISVPSGPEKAGRIGGGTYTRIIHLGSYDLVFDGTSWTRVKV